MIRNLLIGIGCLLLAGFSCSGKGGVKTETQQDQASFVSEASGTFKSDDVSVAKQSEQLTSDQTTASSDAGAFQLELFYCSDSDRMVFDQYLTYIAPFRDEPIQEVVIRSAQFFLNNPYEASTLEIEPEGLVINLRTFDCTTLVETALALAQTVKRYEQPIFDEFCDVLRNIRYRRGLIKDYTSRNHYFSDWIYENENREYVKDITSTIGGEPYQLNLHFMSSHPERYKQLASHPELVDVMREKEVEISKRTLYALIRPTEIGAVEKTLRSGDIVCFVTDIAGLDVSHVGLVYQDKGRCTFLHASTTANKVIVEPASLQAYVKKNKRNIGIMVVRPYFFR